MFNLKECTWNYSFKFEVVYSKNGVARIYVGDRITTYSSSGYGYDKESDVIAKMINDLTMPIKYDTKLYGNINCKLSLGGVGFDSIKRSFNSKRGNKLTKLYCGKYSDVYEIKINPKYLKTQRKQDV